MNSESRTRTQARTGPSALVAAYPATTFVVVAFATQSFIVATQYFQIRNHGLSVLRVFTPALAALAVAYLAQGKSAAAHLVSSLFNVRVPLKYWLFALVYPSFVAVLALLCLRAVGAVNDIHFDFAEAAGLRFLSLTAQIAASEEIAWVGFLLAVFSARYRLFQACLLVGLFWGLWYVPLVIADIQVAPGLPIVPLILNFMTIAAICGWLYVRTRSAAVVFVMQATTNYTSQIIPVLPLRGGLAQYVAFVLMKCLFGLALFAFWGPKPMFGRVPSRDDGSRDARSTDALPTETPAR